MIDDEEDDSEVYQFIGEMLLGFIEAGIIKDTGNYKKDRHQLLIDAGIFDINGDYNKDLFPEAYAADKKPIIPKPILEPRAFKVIQKYNKHTYYIKMCYNQNGRRWCVFVGSEDLPDTFDSYPEFKNGFDTPELALEQLTEYLIATS